MQIIFHGIFLAKINEYFCSFTLHPEGLVSVAVHLIPVIGPAVLHMLNSGGWVREKTISRGTRLAERELAHGSRKPRRRRYCLI